jgi:autotransporter-associated beta strand protein
MERDRVHVCGRGGRKACRLGLAGALLAVFAAQAQLETAGTLLVDLSPASLSGLDDGTTVPAWPNVGTLGGAFVPVISGTGAVYEANVGGVPAVTFARSANSVMTNTVAPPASLLGSNTVWSAELWVLNPTLENPEDQFAWTDRGSWTGSADGTCMEIRYGSDSANAVEHYNSTCNIPWSGSPPVAGLWHYIAITRDASGAERLYADGALRTTKTPPISNLRSGAPFALGGVWDRGAQNWQMLFSGSLARVRVHDGTLTDGQVAANYQAESGLFQTVWAGTPGQALPWDDPANWEAGNVGTAGQTVFINNGGIAVLTNDLALNHLYPVHGGLTVAGGAELTLAPVASVYPADGAAFALTLSAGALRLPGSSTVNLHMGNNGGSATVTVGGGGQPAVLEVDRDTILANSAGGIGTMTVGAGGGVYNSNGWFYVANGVGAQAVLTVDGGEIGFLLPDRNFVVNASGARGAVTVDDGLIDASGAVVWSSGTATNAAYGALHLNGGAVRAKQLYASSTAGTNLLYLNGGTVRAVDSRANFMYNLTAAHVQAGGAVFELPAGVTVTAAQALTEDPENAGGGLTKTGAGRIIFAGANTFTGDIDVRAGDLFFSAQNGLPDGYAGTVTLTNDAEATIGYAKVGGPAHLLARLDTSSKGYLTLFPSNSADTVDFSLFPHMKLAFLGLSNYTGTFIPYGGAYTFRTEGSTVTNGMILTDAGATPGRLTVIGASGGGMVLTGDNSFTGGAEIDGATVTLAHANALGAQAEPGVPDIELRNGAVLRFAAEMDVNALVTGRLAPGSEGILLVGAANAAKDIDLSDHPGLVVGSAELSLDYTGTLTPAAALGAFRLGGGNATYAGQSHRGFSVSNLTDGAEANRVVIGTPGIVELKAGNAYSGGTVVTNRGVLFLKEDGLGAVPAAPDPDNLYVDNGVIRSGSVNFTLHANRGLAVGPGGLELHPWGGYTMTVAGDLSGSGKITSTDSGWVTFAGADNTYGGLLEIASGRNVRIGDGAHFSWPPSAAITLNGQLALNSDADLTFAHLLAGNGSLRKEGAGTLTLAAPNTYGGVTTVDAGTLRLAETNALPSGAGKGAVTLAAGAVFETDGRDQPVGGLNGFGTVTNSTGGAATLYLGANGVTASFGGVIDPALAVVKTGSGKQTLTNPDGAASGVSVQAGTLGLENSTLITGAVSVADGATLSVSASLPGLHGEFYKLSSTPVVADFVSLAAVNAFLAGRTPNLVTNSTYLGASFDMGATSTGYTPKFPSGYNAASDNLFVIRWSGWFYAETDGDYAFATASDDGSMVFVDGGVAFDNNAMQSYTVADRLIHTPVYLTKGYHEIVIVLYENTGDQGLTVWLTPPSGTQALLPNALLSSGTGAGDGARVGTLSGGAGGTLSFDGSGPATLILTDDGDMAFGGAVLGSNTLSRFVKEGGGTLTLSGGESDHFGTLEIQTGALVLTNGAGVLGTLDMAGGAETRVFGRKGLEMQFFNRSAADNDYSEFQSLAAWTAYLAATFPSGPDYVTNSLMLGANLDTGTAGTAWPAPYVQGTGAEQETFDMSMSGKIFLDRTGTYTFGTQSDDGSGVFIDGALVVNNGYNQGITTPARYGTIALTAGFHDIVIPYRENTGGNALRVYLAYPGGPTNLLPQAILFSGAALRGLAGEAGSALDLGADGAVALDQTADTLYAGTLLGGAAAFIQKDGPGTLTLTDDNAAYAGGYAVVGGALRVGDGGLSGSLGPTASVAVGEGGTLVFDRDGTVTVGGAVSGTGLIVLDGPGEVYVTSANAFAGTVVVNAGRLTFAPGATLGAAAVITNSASVEIETSGARRQSGIMDGLAGDGELVVSGGGTLVLNSDNAAYTGTVRVAGGATLRVSSPANLGGGGVALDGGTLAVLPDVEPGTNGLAHALDQAEWTRNGAAVWVTRGESLWLQMTPNTGSQAGSAFCNTTIEPGVPWYAAFRYETGEKMSSPADGVTFIVQNDARGATALGGGGGAIGATGITPSLGVFLNIYEADSIGWIVDGNRVDATTAINGLDLAGGVDMALAYDGVKLTLTVTQGETVYTAEREIDLHAKFGGTAYVGFTGGTGGSTAQQFVGNFAMHDAVATSAEFATVIAVADGQTGALTPVLVEDGAAFSFGGFVLGDGAALNVSPATASKADAGYAVAVSNVTVAAGTAAVNVAANGAGAGVLALDTLTFGGGAKLVVTGAVSAPGGVLTVVVPTPVPRGLTVLADFTGATWVGPAPTLVLVDAQGNVLEESRYLFLSNGRLVINTALGSVLFLK